MGVVLDEFAVGSDQEVLQVHSGHSGVQVAGGVPPQPLLGVDAGAFGGLLVVAVMLGVQGGDQAEAGVEEPLIQGLLQGAFRAGEVLAEVFEVAAEVEDVEVSLVFARAVEVGA